MKLSQMIAEVKRQVPALTGETSPDAIITEVLNRGVDECNLISQVWRNEWSFDTVAEKQTYSLSVYCPGYLSIYKSGVWFFDDDGNSKYLYSKTKRWFDQFIRNWRDVDSAAVPNWVWIEGDELGFYQKPSGVNTVKVYGLITGTPMDNNDHYPWTNLATELTALRALDSAIIAYAVWKLTTAVFDKEGRNYYEGQFYKELKKASAQVKRRPDMTSDYDYYIRIDNPSGFLPSA